MTTEIPTPRLDVAALIEQCRRTYADELAGVFTKSQGAGRQLVRQFFVRGVSREDFHDALAFASIPQPDEPADRFHARRSGFYEGLIAGIGDVSAR